MTATHDDRLQVEYVPVDAVRPHPRNARKGRPSLIRESMDANGVYKPLIVQQSTGYILAGNHAYQAHKARGATEVPVIYRDVTDDAATRILLADNRTADTGTYDVDALLGLLVDVDDLTGTGYDPADLDALTAGSVDDYLGGPTRSPGDDGDGDGDGDGEGPGARGGVMDPDRYTKAVNIPQYEPREDVPPALEELVDTTKRDALVEQIDAADGVPEDVKVYLRAAAERHVVFRYDRAAEFYAHAAAAVQELMEASALVIVDVDDAIAHGYVRLSSRLEELREQDRELYDAGYRFDEDDMPPEDALEAIRAGTFAPREVDA